MFYMSDADVIRELTSTSPLNEARRILSAHCGYMSQREMINPIEMRKLEFEVIQKIQRILNSNVR